MYEHTINDPDKFNSSINTDWYESTMTEYAKLTHLRAKSLDKTGYSLASNRNNLYSKMRKY